MISMSNWRTIFIWDVHWCYKEFKLLLKKLNLNEDDRVYLTWDLISRWPKSFKVLKYIYNNNTQFNTVLWNNEFDFIKWNKTWEKKYFREAFTKIKEKIIKYPEILDFLEKIPVYIEKENFLLVHWWLIPWKKLEDHTKKELVNTTEINWKAWYLSYNWCKKIIYWHWWEDWLRIRKNTIWLDTWCVYWKWLTAYILETWEIIQQSSKDIYINLYEKNNED